MSTSASRPVPLFNRIDSLQLRDWLADGAELALLDVRELGVFTRKHLLFAVNAPLFRLELQIDALVPRRDTRIVLTDLDETLSRRAADKLAALGYRNLTVHIGGALAWEAAGLEVYTGSNVPSKAFGEVIEAELHTPHIDADNLAGLIERGEDLVVVDSRTPEEFFNFSLPGAHSLPGAELVYRIGEVAPRSETLVVVNCAGRTRSILGAQTLINAGLPNRVVSLKDGTMAWLLGGRQLESGRLGTLPEPGSHSHSEARYRAQAMAERAGVTRVNTQVLDQWRQDARRSLYLFDVRTQDEFRAGHLPGWRWAPGGQLVQATDEYIGIRHSRVVLADWDGVRALTTAAWLAQLGGYEVYVYTPPAGIALETGPEARRLLQGMSTAQAASAALTTPAAAQALLQAPLTFAFDIDNSLAYGRAHVPGARFAAPDRLHEFIDALPTHARVLLISEDGVLARVVGDALSRSQPRAISVLLGGTAAWRQAGLPTESGRAGVLTGEDDTWYSPYAYESEEERHRQFRAYLQWELDLVGQLAREGETGIRLVRPAA